MQVSVPTFFVKMRLSRSAERDKREMKIKFPLSADYGQSEAEAILDGLADKRNAANGQIFPNTSFR